MEKVCIAFSRREFPLIQYKNFDPDKWRKCQKDQISRTYYIIKINLKKIYIYILTIMYNRSHVEIVDGSSLSPLEFSPVNQAKSAESRSSCTCQDHFYRSPVQPHCSIHSCYGIYRTWHEFSLIYPFHPSTEEEVNTKSTLPTCFSVCVLHLFLSQIRLWMPQAQVCTNDR